MRKHSAWLGWLVLAAGCATAPDGGSWAPCDTGTAASLRALAAVDAATAWVGGSGGTLLRTGDGGRSWQDVAPPGCAACDFRDLAAFSADAAVALVAGQPARLYRTADGGRSWRIVLADVRETAFFDALAFAGDRGVVLGDPAGGQFVWLVSDDAGATWHEAAAPLPPAAAGEAAFAASGSCVALDGRGAVWVASGGSRSALRASWDHGASWQLVPLPLQQGAPSQGAFSLAIAADGRGAVVGGDYAAPAAAAGSAAWTADGGRTWHAAAGPGYRSAVLWHGDELLAVGPGGTSRSRDGGRSWQAVSPLGFHCLARGADGAVWAAGSDGRVARFRPGG